MGNSVKPTCVYLIGAGPGDPGLISVRALDILKSADAVIYDYLVDPRLLDVVPETAVMRFVGKKGYERHITQEEINDCLIKVAREVGGCIVRLKGGDPFVFGRGGEEAIALAKAGIAFKVVPGITSGIAAAAYADIPVTHRGISTSVTLVTGNEDPAKEQSSIDWKALCLLVNQGSTVCFYMGIKNLGFISEQLLKAGAKNNIPVAIVQQGTTLLQRHIITSIENMASDAQASRMEAPAIVVVGNVASLEDELKYRTRLPLETKRIMVTRSSEQANVFSEKLRALGADVIEVPVVKQVLPDDLCALDDAIERLDSYQWLAFTSANGVKFFFERLSFKNKDARALAGIKIAAMGSGTASALRERHIIADVVPGVYRAEEMASAMLEAGCAPKQCVLLARAQVARDALPQILGEAGVEVDVVSAYKTVLPDENNLALLRELVCSGAVDGITVTSSSIAKHLYEALGGDIDLINKIDVFSIGPITSKTLNDLGINVRAQASVYDIPGLTECIRQTYERKE
ncbi:MAG: uroporphyrinogen-III C-methyltransferase [Eggerthellaceae bacterium]|nr:uroporphyrinogen-III C-methyltransferase [Eggerthellaceae bacterium]